MFIGRNEQRSGGSTRYFLGAVDDVVFWNRALTSQEVTLLFENKFNYSSDVNRMCSPMPNCSGIPFDNISVCSSRGRCVLENVCVCSSFNQTYYYGDNCEFRRCSPGYFDPSCTVFSCDGVFSSDSSVCSSHGTCTFPDRCKSNIKYLLTTTCNKLGECFENYYGPSCSEWICNPLVFVEIERTWQDSENYCVSLGGHLVSIHSDEENSAVSQIAQSETIWIGGEDIENEGTWKWSDGTNFDYHNWKSGEPNNMGNEDCIQQNFHSPKTWNDHLCESIEVKSVCNIPTNEYQCNHSCFGILYDDPSVCSAGKGICLQTNHCECSEDFEGFDCSDWRCANVSRNSPDVCSGFGNCSESGICTCFEGYHGDNCSKWSCFSDLPYDDDPEQCSNHGVCGSLDNCTCEENFLGNECQNWVCTNTSCNHTCFDISFDNHSTACSGFGLCTSLDRCFCETQYFGKDCSNWMCNGIEKSDPEVCSSRGLCNGPDSCQCTTKMDISHANDWCSCRPNWDISLMCDITSCFGIRSDIYSEVCSGYGSCTDYNTCKCESGIRDGEECEFSMCFGKFGISACSDHGNCVDHNTCQCKNDYKGEECEYVDLTSLFVTLFAIIPFTVVCIYLAGGLGVWIYVIIVGSKHYYAKVYPRLESEQENKNRSRLSRASTKEKSLGDSKELVELESSKVEFEYFSMQPLKRSIRQHFNFTGKSLKTQGKKSENRRDDARSLPTIVEGIAVPEDSKQNIHVEFPEVIPEVDYHSIALELPVNSKVPFDDRPRGNENIVVSEILEEQRKRKMEEERKRKEEEERMAKEEEKRKKLEERRKKREHDRKLRETEEEKRLKQEQRVKRREERRQRLAEQSRKDGESERKQKDERKQREEEQKKEDEKKLKEEEEKREKALIEEEERELRKKRRDHGEIVLDIDTFLKDDVGLSFGKFDLIIKFTDIVHLEKVTEVATGVTSLLIETDDDNKYVINSSQEKIDEIVELLLEELKDDE